MATKRQGFVERRKVCGYSQEVLAEQLRVDRTSIGRWERGETDPQPHIRPRLASLLKVTPAELDALLFPEEGVRDEDAADHERPPSHCATAPARVQNYLDVGDLDEMMRREFLRLMSIASALIPQSQAQAISESVYEFADSTDAAEYERMNSHLWQVFSLSSSKRAMYPIVREQLNGLIESLKSARTEGTQQELCAVGANLFQIAGEIFFDSNRYTDAAHCYTLAASASKEASEYDLWACALTRHAFVGIYERRFHEVAPLLDAAENIALRGDSQLSTRYWVSAVQAEVFAKNGDLDACHRALDRAEEVKSLHGRIHNGGWLRFDGSRLAEERGTCYVALGRPDLAESALSDALKQPLSSRRRGAALIDLANIGIQQRDIDRLLSPAQDAIELARKTRSGYVVRKLQGLQGQLAPLLSDNRVSSLSKQISVLSSVE